MGGALFILYWQGVPGSQVYGPIGLEAAQVYVPGLRSASVYSPGAQAGQVYVPGMRAGEVL